MSTHIDVLTNLLAGTARGWRGTVAKPRSDQPEQLLKLYDIEASPYCRLVREVLTELDLDVLVFPCPAGGKRFRPEAEKLGGKQLFPLLVDDNTGTTMYESADIIDYLHRTYGRGGASPRGLARRLAVGTSVLSSLFLLRGKGFAGVKVSASKAPEQPLELYSFETSPYSKTVRARLCELELPYILRNTGKGHWRDMGTPVFRDKIFKGEKGTTRNRQWLADNTGRVQVPYLIDGNTGTAMYESSDILDYLDRSYAA